MAPKAIVMRRPAAVLRRSAGKGAGKDKGKSAGKGAGKGKTNQ